MCKRHTSPNNNELHVSSYLPVVHQPRLALSCVPSTGMGNLIGRWIASIYSFANLDDGVRAGLASVVGHGL